jgi:hypothetical protein
MSLTLYTDEPCPVCRQIIRQSTIDLHPTLRDVAIHNFECADCGTVRTKIVSLKPRKRSSELAA